MLKLWAPRSPSIGRKLGRRDFIQAGVLGLTGLTLGDLYRARAVAGATTGRAKAVILYWLDGGPTHLETYDPKPRAPAEFRGPFGAIETAARGILLNELLVEHAKVMDRVSLVRSLHHDHGDHYAAAHWMLTGYLGSNAASMDPQYPGVGAVVSKLCGPRQPGMPSYVAVPHSMTVGLQPGYNSGTYLGVAHNPFNSGGDPNDAKYQVPNLQLPGEMGVDRLDDRRGLLAALDHTRREADRSGLMHGIDAFHQQAFDMLTGEAARRAFDVSSEDPALRDRYGRNHYGQCALLARRLVEAGVTFVTIHNGGWDHHWDLEAGMKSRLPTFDQAVGTLIDDLSQRGLLDETLVVVMGEFGRGPRLNDGGNGGAPRSMGTPGRDHWGNCMSVLLGGGGLRGGQVVGASNSRGEFPQERPMLPADILATIYSALGLPLDTHFANRSGRPISINNGGRPIAELL